MIFRIMYAWAILTPTLTLILGVVGSWHSTTLTLPLDFGMGFAMILAPIVAWFSK